MMIHKLRGILDRSCPLRLASVLGILLCLVYKIELDWLSSSLEQTQPSGISYPATLVTAYYPLEIGSKHSLQEYIAWLSNFFAHTRNPILAYVPPGNMSNVIREMRGGLPLKIMILDFWEIPPIAKHRPSFEGPQHAIDPEKHIHSPALYAIWGAKSWMLQQTALENPFGSVNFFWVDAGAWRNRPFPSFPDAQRVREVFHHCPDRLLVGSPILQPVRVEEPDGMALSCYLDSSFHTSIPRQSGKPYIQGTFFGGSQAIIDWWTWEYYRVLDDWIAHGRFVGKDQDIMIDIFKRHPDSFLLLQSHANITGNPWFFFQPFLASDKDLDGEEKAVLHLKMRVDVGACRVRFEKDVQ